MGGKDDKNNIRAFGRKDVLFLILLYKVDKNSNDGIKKRATAVMT